MGGHQQGQADDADGINIEHHFAGRVEGLGLEDHVPFSTEAHDIPAKVFAHGAAPGVVHVLVEAAVGVEALDYFALGLRDGFNAAEAFQVARRDDGHRRFRGPGDGAQLINLPHVIRAHLDHGE